MVFGGGSSYALHVVYVYSITASTSKTIAVYILLKSLKISRVFKLIVNDMGWLVSVESSCYSMRHNYLYLYTSTSDVLPTSKASSDLHASPTPNVTPISNVLPTSHAPPRTKVSSTQYPPSRSVAPTTLKATTQHPPPRSIAPPKSHDPCISNVPSTTNASPSACKPGTCMVSSWCNVCITFIVCLAASLCIIVQACIPPKYIWRIKIIIKLE